MWTLHEIYCAETQYLLTSKTYEGYLKFVESAVIKVFIGTLR